MKKYYCSIVSSIFYLGCLLIIGVIVTSLPGMITRDVIIDHETLLKMAVISAILMSLAWIFVNQSTSNIVTKKKINNINLIILFCINVLFLCCVIFFKDINSISFINIIPGITTFNHIFMYMAGHESLVDLAENVGVYICLFIPTGLFIYYFFNNMKKFNRYLFTILVISIISELIKLLICRRFNIDNILLNTIGCSLVYFLADYYLQS